MEFLNNDKFHRQVDNTTEIVMSSIFPAGTIFSESLRLVRYYDEKQDREFMFPTNAMDLTARQIPDLYKNRWQIKLFFKWLKKHLKIMKFRDTMPPLFRGCLINI